MSLTPRIWRHPDLRDGATLHHITDSHIGGHNEAGFADDWMTSIAEDLDRLRVANNAGHVHTGDMIHWYDGGANTQATCDREESFYKTWRATVKGDGLPFAEAVGNHDLVGPIVAGARVPRTSAAWAASMGLASQNNVYDLGQVKVITVGPQTWAQPSNYVLSVGTLAWLDTQLQAAGKPCWVAAHVPFNEQYGSNSNGAAAVEPGNPALTDLIASNPNAIGWLSGHRHVDIRAVPRHATSFAVGGRRIFGVNGPSCGGGSAVPFADHQWHGWNHSMFLTYLGDSLDVRWRDHNSRAWINPPGETVRHVLLNP